MAIDRDELIGRRAYQLWEAEGRPDGGDFRHWLQASEEVGEASIGRATFCGNRRRVTASGDPVRVEIEMTE